MAETDNMNLALPGSNEYVDVEVLNENFRKIDAAVLLALAAAAPYSAQTYALGAYCTRGGRLYRCTTAITAAETWTAGHWTETTVVAELIAHINSTNPHGVTAAQTGAYSKGETDTLLAKKMVNDLGQAGANLLEWASAQTSGGSFIINPTVTTTGVPVVTWYTGLLEVNSAGRKMTITQGAGGAPITYVNVTSAGVWQDWNRLATAAEVDTKVSKSGDTMTGKLTANAGIDILGGRLWFQDSTNGFYISNFSTSGKEATFEINAENGYAIFTITNKEGTGVTYNSVLHTGNAQTLGFPKIAIGSYVGTGTWGSGSPSSLTFGFEPKVVIIVQNSHDNFPGTVFIRGQTLSGTIGENYISNSQLTVGWSGNTVSWFTSNSNYGARAQLNISGNTYFYAALG